MPRSPRALGDVEQAHEVDDERRRERRVLAEEVDLDLHRDAGKADDVDVVPGLFRVAARLVVVDVHLVVLDVVADDRVEHRGLAQHLGLVRAGGVEHQAVAVAEEVRRVPALDVRAVAARNIEASAVLSSVWPVLPSMPANGLPSCVSRARRAPGRS